MKRILCMLLIASVMIAWLGFGALARKTPDGKKPPEYQNRIYATGRDMPFESEALHAAAAVDTYVLAYFNFENSTGGPDPQGWFGVDLTEQPGLFFHVDDFAGLNGGNYGGLVPLEGDQSLWCGARADAGDADLCGYAALPGYGNGWDQRFESVEFAHSGDVTLACEVHYDSEPNYDYTYIQYQNKDDEWITILTLDDTGGTSVNEVIPGDSLDGSVKLRFRFIADGAWSDQDGLWNTDGAVIIDQLTISDTTGVLDYQDFEGEAVGDQVTSDGDWTAKVRPGFGDYSALFPGPGVLQEDPCHQNLSHLWGFFSGSPDDYGCNGYPEQKVVPYGREIEGDMVYINNEVWSPLIDWTHDIHGTPVPGTANEAYFEHDRYRNSPLNALILYSWHARSWIGVCPGPWHDWESYMYSAGPEWVHSSQPWGYHIPQGTEQIQLALAAFDMCPFWCGKYGTGDCHSHAPLYDNVKFSRVVIHGPQWTIREHRLFQDTFPENGTSSGTGRIDIASDLLWDSSTGIMHGDSAVVTVGYTPDNPLNSDPYTGFGPAAYMYMRRDPQSKPMPLDKVVEDGFRWPLVDSVMCNNHQWFIFRMDSSFNEYSGPRTNWVYDTYCVDVNDHYFTNGDTLWYFFGAQDAVGEWSFLSRSCGAKDPYLDRTIRYTDYCTYTAVATMEEACASPMEMQILPGEGVANGGNILYVNNFTNKGARPYFDSAFEILGIDHLVDRFDKLEPKTSYGYAFGNNIGYLATTAQLHENYRFIIWNSGSLNEGTVGDGTTEKSDDYQRLYEFLDLHPHPGGAGIYFSGDDLAEELNGMSSPSSQNFKNDFMPHALVTGDHTTMHWVSPQGIGEGAGTGAPPSVGIFDHGLPEGRDTLIVLGGCPNLSDFDVIAPTGTATLEMCYDPADENDDSNPAVVAFDKLNTLGNRVATVLSGFSFHCIRDDHPQSVPDRADHLWHILSYLGNPLDEPTEVKTSIRHVNSLAQNYPNPFNPVTTIRYSIEERGHVSLKIYNVAGRLVRSLVNEVQQPHSGGYAVEWNGLNDAGSPVASGIYFYKIAAKNFSKTKKMLLLK